MFSNKSCIERTQTRLKNRRETKRRIYTDKASKQNQFNDENVEIIVLIR